MKILLLALTLTSLSAMAHFEIGTYTGSDTAGNACELEFIKVDFNGEKHPLNELVEIEISHEGLILPFNISHRPMFNGAKFGPEKEILTGAKFANNETSATRVYMNSNGPFKFEYYKKDTSGSKMISCTSLMLQESK